MKLTKVSICYHPTTVALIDDKKTFLDKIKLVLNKKFPYQFYTQPQDFLKHYQQYQFNPFLNRCVSIDNDTLDHGRQDIDFRAIRKEIYNSNRFNELSTMVVDYDMPGMNGLECCQAVTNKYINKILLTGQADNELAVAAFNQRIIHQFIQKSSLDVHELINQAIEETQLTYFLNLSEKLYDVLPTTTTACLTDPVFVDFFYKLCREKNIIEYYLTDELGNFIMLDRAGKSSWLVVANAAQLEGYYDLASHHPDVPPTILKALKTKTKIPYFYSDNDLTVGEPDWEEYLHPAHLLEGKTTYYYAYITEPTIYEFDRTEFVSYQQFLEKSR